MNRVKIAWTLKVEREYENEFPEHHVREVAALTVAQAADDGWEPSFHRACRQWVKEHPEVRS